jgi:hypothetical protein
MDEDRHLTGTKAALRFGGPISAINGSPEGPSREQHTKGTQ